jgi:HD-GYP domain-containing protein (c-di-GMP phosphodiesterase class II)
MGDLDSPSAETTSAGPIADYNPDRRRMQLLWLAIGLIGLLTVALVVLVAYGQEIAAADYGEPLLLIGLLAFVTCTVAYFADKDREHRAENRRLIHELHETAKALDMRVARLNKLSETSVHLAGALDLDRISELIVQALVDQVHADAASLVLLDTTKGEYVHTRSMGPLAERDAEGGNPLAIAQAAASQGPLIRQLDTPPAITEQLKAWEKIRGSIAAPVKVSDVIGGALAAIREERFDTEDLNLLTTLANMSSKAIESAELHQQLRQSYYRTLHVLARSLAARDPYSAAHGEAVTWLACRLGDTLGLGEDEMEALQAYGALHDLGKIGISDTLLSKQGPLTAEESEIVRQHALIGESIIQPLSPGAAALAMIRNHHERWDGQGYPDGLKRDEIPLLARVVAVADACHAIVSHRPYRSGATLIEAVQEVKAMTGSQFDPRVVDALVQLWHSGALADYTVRLGTSEATVNILDLPTALTPPAPRRAVRVLEPELSGRAL